MPRNEMATPAMRRAPMRSPKKTDAMIADAGIQSCIAMTIGARSCASHRPTDWMPKWSAVRSPIIASHGSAPCLGGMNVTSTTAVSAKRMLDARNGGRCTSAYLVSTVFTAQMTAISTSAAASRGAMGWDWLIGLRARRRQAAPPVKGG